MEGAQMYHLVESSTLRVQQAGGREHAPCTCGSISLGGGQAQGATGARSCRQGQIAPTPEHGPSGR